MYLATKRSMTATVASTLSTTLIATRVADLPNIMSKTKNQRSKKWPGASLPGRDGLTGRRWKDREAVSGPKQSYRGGRQCTPSVLLHPGAWASGHSNHGSRLMRNPMAGLPKSREPPTPYLSRLKAELSLQLVSTGTRHFGGYGTCQPASCSVVCLLQASVSPANILIRWRDRADAYGLDVMSE